MASDRTPWIWRTESSGMLGMTADSPSENIDAAEVDVLGLRLHALTQEQALARLLAFIRAGTPHQVITADATSFVIAATDAEYRELLRVADLVTPDGAGLLWAARREGIALPDRVSGVDLAEHLCARSGPEEYDVYFYGAAPGVADRAAAELRQRYPGARIVGVSHGFLDENGQTDLIADIQRKRPEVLLVGMGIPRQEKWIAAHQDQLRVPVAMGVGGSFDVFAGVVKRAPAWLQRHGWEWAYRLLQDPRKVKKVSALPRFVVRVLRRQRLPSS